tara:strand:+ start:349 stop:891 length:543 start_codon:yes stop_codon:yes gene_type:complete
MPFKKISESEVVLTELMIPSYANFGGKVHGGVILSLMDKVAYVCATKHAENYCVTASVGAVDFLAPVDVGDLVSLKARVNYVGRSSMIVGIRVEAENFKKGIVKHTNSSYFTFVAIDKNEKPVNVPGLELITDTEIRRFAFGKLRKEQKTANKKGFDELKSIINLKTVHQSWSKENCKII